MCPPLSWRENKWKDSRERWLWIAPVPARLEDAGISLRLDWVKMSCDRETRLLRPYFWSQQLTPFIVSSSGRDNSIKGFTGLHVQWIHKAPGGSSTKMSQTSMKSHLRGLRMDFRLKTVFGPFLHQRRVRLTCWEIFFLMENCLWRPIYRMLSHIITNV